VGVSFQPIALIVDIPERHIQRKSLYYDNPDPHSLALVTTRIFSTLSERPCGVTSFLSSIFTVCRLPLFADSVYLTPVKVGKLSGSLEYCLLALAQPSLAS
jgi:hypothetical protein